MLESYVKYEERKKEGFVVFSLAGKASHFETWASPDDFQLAMSSAEPHTRSYYETIAKNDPQKPRFDIDISDDHWDYRLIVNDLLSALLATFNKLDIKLGYKDVQIFNSNGISNGKYKWSYHIVIDTYYHSCNDEALTFYNQVISRVNPNFREYIDKSVYKSLQQFRLLGNSKHGENRFKTRMYEWDYNGSPLTWVKATAKEEFIKSLIVVREDLSKYTLLKVEKITRLPSKNELIDESLIEDFIPEGYEIEKTGDFGYKLKRVEDSYCNVCKRVHENENAYIRVSNGLVILKCYRDLSKYYILGTLKTKSTEKVNKREIASKSVKKEISVMRESYRKSPMNLLYIHENDYNK